MQGLKSSLSFLRKNRAVSQFMLSFGRRTAKAFGAAVPGGNMATFMGVGAGMGATRGLLDNIIGEDRASVLGGAMQGAMMGAGLHGARSMFRSGFATKGIAQRRTRDILMGSTAAGNGRLALPHILSLPGGARAGTMRW